MPCSTGFDYNGCEMPQTCVPINGNLDIMEEYLYQILKTTQVFLFKSNTGPTGVDGTNCPGACPTVCPSDDLTCQGNVNDNGCDMPQFCLPSGSK